MKKCIRLLILISVLFRAESISAQPDSLKVIIAKIANAVKAEVGVAVMNIESQDTLTFNGRKRFPMQSVYKFHLGLAILNLVDKGKLTLDQKVHVSKEDIYSTWSPLAAKFPEANVDLTVGDLLTYTVTHSDNVACDILFRLAGGPSEVQKFMDGIGATEVSIVSTEKEMHTGWEIQFQNWTTPYATMQLLQQFYQRKILSEASHVFMWKAMVDCQLGPRRIKGMLPPGTLVAHRTGTGAPNDKGTLGAVNNVGIITLPNGKHIAIAVYITNGNETQNRLEEVIAKISKAVFDHYAAE
jgi:beta-lactamase class A